MIIKYPNSLEVFTIGHSNRSFDEFFALLESHEIAAVADIRSFPSSRKFPHFNRDNLEKELSERSVKYVWLKRLGGRRAPIKGLESPNTGLTVPGFRSYADYMATEEFREGVDELLRLAEKLRTAYMCAEALFWRCHRKLLSDYLTARGIKILHIIGPKSLVPHKLSEEAIVTPERSVIYPDPNTV